MIGSGRKSFCVACVFWATLLYSYTALQAEVVSVSTIADRIEHVTFTSDAFRASRRFCVVLPKDYDTRRSDWPVLYLLHGRGRNELSLIENPTAKKALLDAPFVTVLPDGDDGWYLDSLVNPKERYEQLLDETINAAEAKYHLSRDPRKRAVAGWSMGGYGAVRYAENHPKQFALVASMIGLVDFPRPGLPDGQSHVVPKATFGTNEAAWKKLNPIHSAEQLRGSSVVLITADKAFDRTMNRNFRDRLQGLQIEHEWIELKGEHTFDVVVQALPIVLKRVQTEIDGQR